MPIKDDRWIMTEDDHPMFYLKETGINGITIHYHEETKSYSIVNYGISLDKHYKSDNEAKHYADPHFTKLKITKNITTIRTINLFIVQHQNSFLIKDAQTKTLKVLANLNDIPNWIKLYYVDKHVTVKMIFLP